MKKGFTLIELLAVIVILAIIALIASPIVIGLIEDAQKEAAERSTEAVVSAAKTYYATQQLNGAAAPTSVTVANLDVDNKPSSGTVTFATDGTPSIVTATNLVFASGYNCTYAAGV